MYHFELRYILYVHMYVALYTKVSVFDMGSWVSIHDDMFLSIEVGTHVRQEYRSCRRVGNQNRNQDIPNHVPNHFDSHVQI